MKSARDKPPNGGSEPYNTAAFSASSLERIDAVCVEFEKAWKGGKSPALESFLNGFDNELRSALFAELLLLDIDYRMREGQTPDPADYETRFPDEATAIESAFKSTGESGRKRDSGEDLEHLPPHTQLELVSRFELRSFHAQGGLGVVYAADDQNLGRTVAIKIPRKRAPGTAEQIRLAREAGITGRLEHPGIVPVYARGFTDDGRPWYVMPLIEGQTLQVAIREFHNSVTEKSGMNPFDSLAFRQLLQRFLAVCNAVAYAHEQKVIHRDIKPDNIMLGKFGETFLLDWGLAKSLSQPFDEPVEGRSASEVNDNPFDNIPFDQTAPGQQIGTPAFASPEQVTGDVASHDTRSDIYSLGATLYCMLTGKSPINSSDLTSAKSTSALQQVPKPRELKPAIPRAMEAICLKAMAFQQRDRYDNVMKMTRDIERFLADEPVCVLPEPWTKKAGRWGRKHPRTMVGMVTTISIAAVSFAIGSVLLSSQNRLLVESNGQLDRSTKALQQAQTQTLNALSSLTDGMIERWLARSENLSLEDQLFIESILERYQRFANSQFDESESQVTRADGFYRVGQLQQILGKKREAIEVWESGLAAIERDGGSTSTELRRIQSKMLSYTGVTLADLGERQRGLSMITTAVEIQFELLDADPRSVALRLEFATLLDRLGNAYLQLGQYELAEQQFRKSLDFSMVESDATPREALAQIKRTAGIEHNLGLALLSGNKFAEAKKHLEISLSMHRELAEKSSKINYELDLGRVLYSLGSANRSLKEPELAKFSFTEAIDHLGEFSKTYPSLAEPLRILSRSHFGLAGVEYDSGNFEGALAHCKTAKSCVDAAMTRSPEQFENRLASRDVSAFQGMICTQLNRPDEAEAHFRDAIAEAELLFAADNQFLYRQRLVALFNFAARLCFQKQDFTATRELAQKALNLIEELGDDADRKQLVFDEVGCRQYLGWCLLYTGKLEESAEYWRRIVELTELRPIIMQGVNGKENVTQSARIYLTLCIARTHPDQALKDALDYASDKGLVPSQTYNLSCAAAMSSQYLDDGQERKRAEILALELLERSVNEDYFVQAGQLDKLLDNPSFKTLLEDVGFKRIIAIIESAD